MNSTDHEVVIVGAGVCGLYQLITLKRAGFDATLLEAAPDLGGTWYWNRYPGARFDSESYTYAYSFSRELLEGWSWSERFAAQPETLRYLHFVADQFDLRQHMQFGVRLESAVFDDEAGLWELEVSDGRSLQCRYLILAVGLLSAPTVPSIAGLADFAGRALHTQDWPAEGFDLDGRRVGVVGTGPTGVQLISEIAGRVLSLAVFQRRPNWCAPLRNSPIPDTEMASIRKRYAEIFARCESTPGGFIHGPDERPFDSVLPEERLRTWECLYAEPGFAKWLGNFREVLTDPRANAEFSAFMADKIRARVHNRSIAEKLIPKDHGFGAQRVALETNYFEVYNKPNVELVDLLATPIERATAAGLRTTARDYDLDVLVFATGFDAITGAFDRIEIRGSDGARLRSKWAEGPVTYLGIMVSGFPNMFMPTGPQSVAGATNFPRGIEVGVNWVAELMVAARQRGYTRLDATADGEAAWVSYVKKLYGRTLMGSGRGWFTGYNSNIVGRDTGVVRYMVFNGGLPRYREVLGEVAKDGYPAVNMT